MISLVMLSGGLDSAYSLVRLLSETDDEVLVHHIHLMTSTNRHDVELEAVAKIVKYCHENIREFSYTQTAIDHRKMAAHGYDMVSAGFEAGVIAASYHLTTQKNIDRWIVGLAEDDIIPRHRFKDGQDCCDFNCQTGNAPELYMYQQINPQAEADYLGSDLFDMTWSCRKPKFVEDKPEPCTECLACLRRLVFDPPQSKTPSNSPIENSALLPWRLVTRVSEGKSLGAEQLNRSRLEAARKLLAAKQKLN